MKKPRTPLSKQVSCLEPGIPFYIDAKLNRITAACSEHKMKVKTEKVCIIEWTPDGPVAKEIFKVTLQ